MPNPDSPVHFLRKKDYLFVRVLGQGACGQTVLLRDDVIGSDFVCKKYVPFSESLRQELFKNFLREIKLLHEVYHPNVVRVFNYYVYPEKSYTSTLDFVSNIKQHCGRRLSCASSPLRWEFFSSAGSRN